LGSPGSVAACCGGLCTPAPLLCCPYLLSCTHPVQHPFQLSPPCVYCLTLPPVLLPVLPPLLPQAMCRHLDLEFHAINASMVAHQLNMQVVSSPLFSSLPLSDQCGMAGCRTAQRLQVGRIPTCANQLRVSHLCVSAARGPLLGGGLPVARSPAQRTAPPLQDPCISHWQVRPSCAARTAGRAAVPRPAAAPQPAAPLPGRQLCW